MVSAALSLSKHHHGLGASAPEQRLRHLRRSFVPAPSKDPSQPLPPYPLRCAGVRGVAGGPGPLTCPVPGWETSCPALSSALRDPASASAPGWGEVLPRALPPCTERRDFGARKAVADPPPSRPSPPPALPSRPPGMCGRHSPAPTAGTNFSSSPCLPGPTGPPERSVSGKGAPGPGAMQGKQGHRGPLECRERRVRPGKGGEMFSGEILSRLCLCPQSHIPCWAGVAFGPLCPDAQGQGAKNPSG